MPTLSLKTQNLATLVSLVVICLSISWISEYGFNELKTLQNTLELLGGVVVLSPLVVLITNLIPADIKHMLVFFRFKNVLPGHRFIQLVKKDSRLSMDDLIARFPNSDLSSMNEKAQNIFWYKEIYRPNQEDTQVKSAHRMFLLYRDTSSALLLLSLIATLLHLRDIQLFNHQVPFSFALTMLAQYTLVIIAAIFAGKRMVTNAVCALLKN